LIKKLNIEGGTVCVLALDFFCLTGGMGAHDAVIFAENSVRKICLNRLN